MDEVALEYRVTGLRRELRDLEILRENLKSEVNDLRAQLLNAQYQLRAKRSELDAVKRNLEYERFSEEILKDIVTEASDHLT
jgi:predicted  nucleic acid-binding Zn-ribbon protein